MDGYGLALLLMASLFFSGGGKQEQASVVEPESIAGPWETVSAGGIDGVFVEYVTDALDRLGNAPGTRQSVEIRVYHRQDKKESWGWFSTEVRASLDSSDTTGPDIPTQFDGRRLRINFNETTELKPFVLDVTFSPSEKIWTGIWSRDGQSFHVVLERPNTNGLLKPSGFVGDWEGESSIAGETSSLHIRVSQDGILSAWLDRTTRYMNPGTKTMQGEQRDGELLHVYAIPGEGVTLETDNSAGVPSHYRATLSEDQQVITGSWSDETRGRVSAPVKFRRVAME